MVLVLTTNKPMGHEAQLARRCLFMLTFLEGDFDPKVGQIDPIFGVQSECISGYERVGVQVSVCSGYDLCHPR